MSEIVIWSLSLVLLGNIVIVNYYLYKYKMQYIDLYKILHEILDLVEVQKKEKV